MTNFAGMPAQTTHIAGLPVMEAFYTIQGEGFHQGRAAYFIRLGGCDVGCNWCDVKESWDALVHPLKTVDEIVAGALAFPAFAVAGNHAVVVRHGANIRSRAGFCSPSTARLLTRRWQEPFRQRRW